MCIRGEWKIRTVNDGLFCQTLMEIDLEQRNGFWENVQRLNEYKMY